MGVRAQESNERSRGTYQVSFVCYRTYTSVCCGEKKSRAEFFVVQEMGGRACMDVSAAKSDVINVVVA